jgi:hypothetical protein
VSDAAEELVELPAGGVLEDEDDSVGVVEPGEEAEHVGVVEAALDLELPLQLDLDRRGALA